MRPSTRALVAGAAVVLLFAVAVGWALARPSHPAAPGSPERPQPTSTAGTSAAGHSAAGAFSIRATNPAPDTQAVASNTTITLTFSQPLAPRTPTPELSPIIGGTWVRSSPTTLAFRLDSPLIPSSQEVVTIPGGPKGVRSASGAALSATRTVSFTVASGDTLRLQQLLAGLDYLPVTFTSSGPAVSRADLALDQTGSFSWRWAGLPTELTSQWTQGSDNEITTAAVMSFENQNGLGVDGIAGPAVWTDLINDTINDKASTVPYVYVLVNKVLPETLTLWDNGTAQYSGIPVNTGAPGADTTDGTYAVFEHVRFSDMKGTNPDGTTYNDPNVPFASYFNGGDALHGFIRATYGSPQSNGCVEMTYADAALVWPLTPVGTLVTVEGPNYGSAPPSTTTTTTTTTVPPSPTPASPASAPTTTTTPAQTTTTTASAAG
ncbi:MAG TPA: L,D-transpeptidase family protein [Acidimicrobiales bacterium]|nr:L,D-transpeptidase family protein [Acidimicrobiales bacterium]